MSPNSSLGTRELQDDSALSKSGESVGLGGVACCACLGEYAGTLLPVLPGHAEKESKGVKEFYHSYPKHPVVSTNVFSNL